MDRLPPPDRAFSWLLWLYPREFRGDFGDEMRADFLDQRQDAHGRAAVAGLWGRTILGVLAHAPREHLQLPRRDAQYALRLLAHSPGFAIVAVLTVALGIGTNAAVFGLADGVLFRALPFHEPDRLALIQTRAPSTGRIYNAVSRIDVEHIRTHRGAIADIAFAANTAPLSLTTPDGAVRVTSTEASANFLDLLGVRPHAGRLLRPGDEVAEPRRAVITYQAWQSRFGSDPQIVGRTVQFDERRIDIVGILPADFVYPLQGAMASGELLSVSRPVAGETTDPRAIVLTPVARLQPGVSFEKAQSELDVLVRQAAQAFPGSQPDRALRIAELQSALFELTQPMMWLLVGAASFVLLIACVNLAALLTSRSVVREREIAVRLAIGASRGRIVRQLMVESLMLAIAGGAVALAAAALTFPILAQYVPESYPMVPTALTLRTVGFACVLTLVAGMLFGIVPALRLAGSSLQPVLSQNRRSARNAGRLLRAGMPLIATELALAMVLITATGLMVNSLVRLRTADLGFEPRAALMFSVTLPRAQYASAPLRYEYLQRVLDEIRALPNVAAAGAIDYLPIGGMAPPTGFRDGTADVGVWRITAGYLGAMGIPILAGRDFNEDDARTGAQVVIVSESVARHFWPDGTAIGRSLALDKQTRASVVGVVKDVRARYGGVPRASAYRPMTSDRPGQTIVARGHADAAGLPALMKGHAQRLERRALVSQPAPVSELLRRGIVEPAFETSLFTLFGVLAVLVAAVGIYGLMAAWVGARTREMGIRIALGATTRQVKMLVARQSLAALTLGLAAGTAGAFFFARRLEGELFGITPHDLPTYCAVAAILVGVGMTASYLPARRASRVDPVIALRTE